MNKRINQILGQAYDQAVPETWTTLSSEQLGRIYDKFAELIVEEMYDFIMDESDNDRGIPDLGKVKEHFGVES